MATTGDYLERSLNAAVYDVAVESPLGAAPKLSARLGCRVALKREDMQPIFSFKLRWAYNKMARLDAAVLARGVVAASAGNHTQGVALAAEREGARDLDLVAIATGANMNFDRLRHVAERAAMGEQREALFAVTIPEKPGSFRAFCTLLGRRAVTEFNYRYSDADEAHVFVGVEIAERGERKALVASMHRAGLPCLDLSDDETNKLHVRHMVGGRARVPGEKLYRFVFPERPGALARFLDAVTQGANITLFHYRNHGADFGRVLVGVQMAGCESEQTAFRGRLDELGFEYADETDNPAYRLFMRGAEHNATSDGD